MHHNKVYESPNVVVALSSVTQCKLKRCYQLFKSFTLKLFKVLGELLTYDSLCSVCSSLDYSAKDIDRIQKFILYTWCLIDSWVKIVFASIYIGKVGRKISLYIQSVTGSVKIESRLGIYDIFYYVNRYRKGFSCNCKMFLERNVNEKCRPVSLDLHLEAFSLKMRKINSNMNKLLTYIHSR